MSLVKIKKTLCFLIFLLVIWLQEIWSCQLLRFCSVWYSAKPAKVISASRRTNLFILLESNFDTVNYLLIKLNWFYMRVCVNPLPYSSPNILTMNIESCLVKCSWLTCIFRLVLFRSFVFAFPPKINSTNAIGT